MSIVFFSNYIQDVALNHIFCKYYSYCLTHAIANGIQHTHVQVLFSILDKTNSTLNWNHAQIYFLWCDNIRYNHYAMFLRNCVLQRYWWHITLWYFNALISMLAKWECLSGKVKVIRPWAHEVYQIIEWSYFKISLILTA